MDDKWYVATVLMQCRVAGDHAGPWTCDEQVYVLRAPDDKAAYQKALKIGQHEEHSYQNTYDETVTWEFVGLVQLDELMDEAIEDGTEITSRLFDHANPSSLVIHDEDALHEQRG